MPKENINCTAMRELRAEVGWEQGRWVQLATTNQKSQLTLPGDNEGDAPQVFGGWHVTLDREGINRLIRVLRRARDQAFGRDE